MFEQIRNISPLGRRRSKAKLCKSAIYHLLQFMLLGGNTHICHYAPDCLRWRRNAGVQCVIRTEPVADLRGAGVEHPTPTPSRSHFFSILCQNNTTFGVDSALGIPRSATGNWSFCPCFLALCVSLCLSSCLSGCLSVCRTGTIQGVALYLKLFKGTTFFSSKLLSLSFPKCFHWIRWIQWKNICCYCKRARTCHPTTSCVRDQDDTTTPARHMWETRSLNKLSPIHASMIH